MSAPAKRAAKRPSSVSQRATVKRDSWRFLTLWIITIAIFSLLMIRAFYLQVVQHQFLQAKADAMVMSVDQIPAHRGMILDRNDTPLAISTPLSTLWLDPKEYLQQQKEMEETLAALRKDPNSKALKRKFPKTNFGLAHLTVIWIVLAFWVPFT